MEGKYPSSDGDEVNFDAVALDELRGGSFLGCGYEYLLFFCSGSWFFHPLWETLRLKFLQIEFYLIVKIYVLFDQFLLSSIESMSSFLIF